MGDRELPQFNRLLAKRWDDTKASLHARRIAGVRANVDNKAPLEFAHLADRKKTKQKWMDEQARIEHENMILLQKMRTIMSNPQNRTLFSEPFEKGSLNRAERIKQMKGILVENEAFLTRLQACGPTYNVDSWEASYLEKERMLTKMGRFPYKSPVVPAVVKQQPLKRYGTLRFPVPKMLNQMKYEEVQHDNNENKEREKDRDHERKERPSSQHSSSSSTLIKSASLATASPRRIHHLPPRNERTSPSNQNNNSSANATSSSANNTSIFDLLSTQQIYDVSGNKLDSSLSSRGTCIYSQNVHITSLSSTISIYETQPPALHIYAMTPGVKCRCFLQFSYQWLRKHMPHKENDDNIKQFVKFLLPKLEWRREDGSWALCLKPDAVIVDKNCDIAVHIRGVHSFVEFVSAAAFSTTAHGNQIPTILPLPRCFLYIRSATANDYVPYSEVALSWNGRDYTGHVSVPAPVGDADSRVRIALFQPTDPAFQTSLASCPANNDHLIGEARFSMQHFIAFPKDRYKLKILKHGQPLDVPDDQSNADDDTSKKVEAMMVLQLENKTELTQPVEQKPPKYVFEGSFPIDSQLFQASVQDSDLVSIPLSKAKPNVKKRKPVALLFTLSASGASLSQQHVIFKSHLNKLASIMKLDYQYETNKEDFIKQLLLLFHLQFKSKPSQSTPSKSKKKDFSYEVTFLGQSLLSWDDACCLLADPSAPSAPAPLPSAQAPEEADDYTPISNTIAADSPALSPSAVGPYAAMQVKFAVFGMDTEHTNPCIFVFTLDESTHDEHLVGQTESSTSAMFFKSINIGRYFLPHLHLRLVVAPSAASPKNTLNSASRAPPPHTWLADTVIPIQTIMQKLTENVQVWEVKMDRAKDDVELLIRVENPPLTSSTDSEWSKIVAAHQAEKREMAQFARQSDNYEQSPAQVSSVLSAIYTLLAEQRFQSIWYPRGSAHVPLPLQLAEELELAINSDVDKLQQALQDVIRIDPDAGWAIDQPQSFVEWIRDTFHALNNVRTSIHSFLNSSTTHLLPHSPDGSVTISIKQVDQLADDAGLPLNYVHGAANGDALLRHLSSLEEQGLQFGDRVHLAAAVRHQTEVGQYVHYGTDVPYQSPNDEDYSEFPPDPASLSPEAALGIQAVQTIMHLNQNYSKVWQDGQYKDISDTTALDIFNASNKDTSNLETFLSHFNAFTSPFATVGDFLHFLERVQSDYLKAQTELKDAMSLVDYRAQRTGKEGERVMQLLGTPLEYSAHSKSHAEYVVECLNSISRRGGAYHSESEVAQAVQAEPARREEDRVHAERIQRAKEEAEAMALKHQQDREAAERAQERARAEAAAEAARLAEIERKLQEEQEEKVRKNMAAMAEEEKRLAALKDAENAKKQKDEQTKLQAAQAAAQRKKHEEEQKRLEDEAAQKAKDAAAAEQLKKDELEAQRNAAALANDRELKRAAEEIEKQGREYSVEFTIGCVGLPSHSNSMIAIYAEEEASHQFSFVSQTERVLDNSSPNFIDPISLQGLHGREERQFMFSVYNVANENNITEQDMIGTSLISQRDIYTMVQTLENGGEFKTIALPIITQGAILPGAFLNIKAMKYQFAPKEIKAYIFVNIKNIVLPSNINECNPLGALYCKDVKTNSFTYLSQTDRLTNTLNPKFQVALEVMHGTADKECMLNVYNHLSEASEMTEDDVLGACMFSLNKLLSAKSHQISVPLIRDNAVKGTVILKSSLSPTRPNTAYRTVVSPKASDQLNPAAVPDTQSSLEIDAVTSDIWDLTLSCSDLPHRNNSGLHSLPSSMIALYGADAVSGQYAYISQTEKIADNASPTFESTIRIDEHLNHINGDRPLMFMIYDVEDEANITEDNQIGTCALTWLYLREQAKDKTITLPLIGKDGQNSNASIHIKAVKAPHAATQHI